VTLITRELVGEAQYSYNTVEDNIEQESFGPMLVDTMGRVAGNDWEDVLVNGDATIVVPALDENSAASVAAWKRARLLKTMDGVLVKLVSNVVDAGGVRMNAGILKAAAQTMPIPFRDGQQFFTSSNAVDDYWETIAARQTAMGDQAFQSSGEAPYKGKKVVPLEIWPTALGVDANLTSAMLIDPANIILGVQRKMTIETMKDIRRRMYIVVFSCRIAVQLEHEPAALLIENILNSPDV
jgi:hypothetical protein